MEQNSRLKKLETGLEKNQDEIKDVHDSIESLNAQFKDSPIKVELQEKATPPKPTSLSGVIKDELYFISLLILFVGIISTESYYHTFGVKYQFLNLPVFHIIYRGLTANIANPVLLFSYLIAVGWLTLDSFAVKQN
jgi:hypothetical protein